MKKTTTFVLALFALFFLATSCDKEPVEVPEEPLKVLVMAADDSLWTAEVRNKIDSTDLFGTVDTFDMHKRVPTIELLNMYDAVFVYTDDSPYDAEATGNILATYIENGGGVVNATFGGNIPVTGNFTQYAIMTNSSQTSGSARTLGTVANSDHLIMENILTFNGGTASYYNSGATIDENATVIASYDNDEPLVIIQENVGPKNVNRVFLNFFPPSKDSRDDFWDPSTDGALLMGYALLWVAN